MKKKLRGFAIHVGRLTLHVGRWTWYGAAAVLLLLAVAFTAARVLLPALAERKGEIEAAINRHSPHPVRIERLTTYWDGLHPGLHVRGLQVYGADRKQVVLRLDEARLSLALWPLALGRFEIYNLELTRPSLSLERLQDGRFRITGFDPVRVGDQAEGEEFVAWLFRQNRLAIHDGELAWRDHRESGRALRLTRLNLTLRNQGERHRLGLSAVFPPEICRDCSVIADIAGNPFVTPDWNGEIYLRAVGVSTEALPLVARERLPADFRGRFDAQLWTQWHSGRPHEVEGRLAANGLRLPVRGLPAPLAVREAAAKIEWRAEDGGWDLRLSEVTLALLRPAWSAGTLRVRYSPKESLLQAAHLDLDDLTAFLGGIKQEHEWLRAWAAVAPVGAVDNLKFRVIGEWAAPTDFSLETEVAGVSVRPYAAYPGVQGLRGRLAVRRASGEFTLDTEGLTLALPQVFRAPLTAGRASGRLRWEQERDQWRFEADNLRVAVEEGQATGELLLRVPSAAPASPYLRLRADFRDLNGAHAARYYPYRHLSRRALAWMERSFLGGRVTKGSLIFDGPIREFPFARGQGQFEIRARVRDGVYGYLPGWTPVREAEVEVAIDNGHTRVTGHGKIGTLAANDVVVQTKDDPEGELEVHVNSLISGAVNETIGVLRGTGPDPDSDKWRAYLPQGLQGGGEGDLQLAVIVPLKPAAAARVQGEYRFRKGSALRHPASGIAFEGVEGVVRFSERGLRDGRLLGRLLGGETTFTAVDERGEPLIHGEGRMTADGLAPVLGARFAPHITGAVPWRATWRPQNGAGDLSAELELRQLKTRLPPPLDRPAGLAAEKLVVHTETSSRDSHVLALTLPHALRGRLVFTRQEAGWRFFGGRLAFGEIPGGAGAAGTPSGEANSARRKPRAAEERAALPRARGLHVSARLDRVELDPWLPLLGGGGGEAPEFLQRLSAEFRALDLLDRDFGRVAVDLGREQGAWSGTVTGAAASGRLRYSRRGQNTQLELDLAALNLPPNKHSRRDTDTDPRRLPALVVRSKALQVQDMALGELDFAAQPVAGGWHIARLNLARPETKLVTSGDWRVTAGGQQSEFDLRLTSSDFGKTMEALGIRDQLAGGEVTLSARLSWPGPPADIRLATLTGRTELVAERGRFLQFKQGAGRLFGVLDLSAIGRYLTLDFSPVFGRGFVFDRIQSKLSIEKGNAYTDDLSMRGPSAKINIRGRLGLAAEDFDLTLDLQPQLTDSLTLTSLGIWGPQVAATVLALQKIFKKEITARTRVRYTVKGPWGDPNVTRTIEENGQPDHSATP